MMSSELKRALKNDKLQVIRNIENDCRNNIREKMDQIFRLNVIHFVREIT